MDAAKRFWTEVAVAAAENGYSVTLDGRAVRTPTKQAFAVPTRALADAVAEEWRAQGEKLDPRSMPLTRYVNSVIDGITPNRAAVVDTISAYGGTDLLCYRAEHPDVLIARQAERWNPLLDWARDSFDAPLIQVQGVMYSAQPEPSLAKLTALVQEHSDFELAGLHDLVAISGSLVIGLAVAKGRLSAEEGYALSRLDEDWQIEQWGEDEEAQKLAAIKASEFGDAARLMTLLEQDG